MGLSWRFLCYLNKRSLIKNSGLDPVISRFVSTPDFLLRSTAAHLNHVILLTKNPLKNVNAIFIVTVLSTLFTSNGWDYQTMTT